jgi:hypothetical protein
MFNSSIRSPVGFFKSTDGGVSWAQYQVGPAGTPQDQSNAIIDPYDANHILLGGHERATLFESFDQGVTWNSIAPDAAMVGGGGPSVFFVNTGDPTTTRKTWLWMSSATSQCYGTWRTTNGGVSWTKVDCTEHSHGGTAIYQPDTGGVVYMGGVYNSTCFGGVMRSTDYGQTWTHVGDCGQEGVVFGTPKNVYAGFGWACQFCTSDANLQVAPQPGLTGWLFWNGSTTSSNPPGMNMGPSSVTVVFDGTHYIALTGNISSGVWRYVEPTGSAEPPDTASPPAPPTTEPVAVGGEPAPPAAASTSVEVGGAPAVATFLEQDLDTQGTWQDSYGADGYLVEGDAQSIAGYASVSFSDAQGFTWASSTGDVRALQKSASNGDRIAATWFGGAPTVDLNLTDGAEHRVSLYCVDWDHRDRTEMVTVVDASNGASLDARTLSNFSGGVYLSWHIRGHVQFRFTRNAGPNVVVSAIFFDPVTPDSPDDSDAGR